jgi:hypothetical protein
MFQFQQIRLNLACQSSITNLFICSHDLKRMTYAFHDFKVCFDQVLSPYTSPKQKIIPPIIKIFNLQNFINLLRLLSDVSGSDDPPLM